MPSEYLVAPWDHQRTAIERAESMNSFALFFEMGTGKTGAAINMARDKFNQARRLLRTLIFCPSIVVPNWKEEWKKHSRINPQSITPLQGPLQKRLDLFLKITTLSPEAGHIFVMNYESMVLSPMLFTALQAWRPEVLIWDESHKCKDIKSKRTKLACRLSNGEFNRLGVPIHPSVKHRYILTGTPVLNSPMDLFSQILLLDGGRTFGKNFYAFRAQYFVDKNAAWRASSSSRKVFPQWEVRPESIEVINRKISEIGMRVEKKDCMDLPPLVKQTVAVELSPLQAKLYKDMKQNFVAFLNDKAFTATLALTKGIRLQQIASGFCKTPEGETIPLGETPRQAALKELLEAITPTHKVLVWAVWKENYEQIRKVCRDLDVGFVEVHGEISDRQKHENIRIFKENPSTRVFIGHPGSGGIGINLVNAPYSIFYSRNFSLEYDLQAESRNYRGGSEIHEKITRYDLTASGTIDELVQKALAEKNEIGESLFRDLSLRIVNQET